MKLQTSDKRQSSIWTFKSDWKRFTGIVKKTGSTNTHIFHEMLAAYEREQKALKSRDYVAHGSSVSPFQTAQKRSHGVVIAPEGVGTPKTGKGA